MLAIRAERHRLHEIVMPAEDDAFLPVPVPHANGLIVAAGGQAEPVGAEGDRPDSRRMTGERGTRLDRPANPTAEPSVPALADASVAPSGLNARTAPNRCVP